jgi:hypothetical protein
MGALTPPPAPPRSRFFVAELGGGGEEPPALRPHPRHQRQYPLQGHRDQQRG